MTYIGCDPSLIGELDSHSPIELSFDNTPSIYVNATEDGVWLICQVTQCTEEQVRVRAEQLLMSVLMPRSWVDGEFAMMGWSEDTLLLKARASAEALNEVKIFADAVGDFYDLVGAVSESMRR